MERQFTCFFFCCLNSHLFILLFHIVMLWNTIQSHFKTIPVKYRSFNTDIDSTVLLWQCWLWTIRLVWSFLDRCQTRINQENILFFSSSLKPWSAGWFGCPVELAGPPAREIHPGLHPSSPHQSPASNAQKPVGTNKVESYISTSTERNCITVMSHARGFKMK